MMRTYFAPSRCMRGMARLTSASVMSNGSLNLLRPVHDGGAEAIDANAGRLQFFDGDVESPVRDVVEIGLGEARDFDAARFEMSPAEFLRGLDLAVDACWRLRRRCR